MKNFLKRVFFSNIQIKLFSFALGYICWSIINQSHSDTTWIDIPVYFYQAEKNAMIEAPEMVKVSLLGKRSDLRSLDTSKTAVHIDTRNLKQGEQIITLSEQQTILPEKVKIDRWAPEKISVKLEATA
ncbi:hypothetical protein KAH94_05810 [bacterium]|nr:hypothetical protein [bacterium]